ncbi:MAG: DNA mismatch repair endonuclease MutL [bacterium]
MGTKIKVLPEDIANKIAAGEVVQRPASVVKELVENSLDAQSTKIVVEVTDGGKGLIRVSDNGEGMSKEDALLSFERFATSKISTAKDLDAINSFGFRGEALPSIAAVSQVKLITRTKDAISGTVVKIDGGKIKDVSEVGAAIGTVVEVQNLFFNTPARRKFLKTNITEASYINNIVYQNALSHPEVSFRLTHNNQEIINVSATSDFKERILHFVGKELAQDIIPIEFKSDLIEVSGFLAKPTYTRRDRNLQSIFVNQRHVVNKTVTHAIYQGYHTLLPKDRHPIIIIFIKIDPCKVDVNVHPTKREIRFHSESQIHDLIVQAIRKTLSQANLIPEVTTPQQKSVPSAEKPMIKPTPPKQQEIPLPAYTSMQVTPVTTSQPTILPTPSLPPRPLKLESDIQPIGQAFNSYIIAQSREGMFIIDQHAAHERVLYEKLMNEARDEATLPAQILLIPITLETDYKETAVLVQNIPTFNSLGFEIDEFGQNSFIIRSVPAVLEKGDPKELIFELIYELQSIGRSKTPHEIREKILISVSCHSAIKAGDKLAQQEMESLISQLSQTQLPFTCPHGRPVIIKMSINELEKRFMRI